jgi:predicted N-acetyltransferase YhbS
MPVKFRTYNRDADFNTISDFLIRHYRPLNRDGNVFQAIWEYSYTHPWTDLNDLEKIGIWEDKGELVGVTIFEMRKIDIFLNVHPDYQYLKQEMLIYAEDNFSGLDKAGNKIIRVYVNDFDTELEKFVISRNYRHETKYDRPMSQFVIPGPFPMTKLPIGFSFKSLAQDSDIRKIHRVLHRGFNHPGEPLESELGDRKRMLSGPNFRPDLTIVIEAPSGNFVTYCGMWYDKVNKFGYVEPVATDPDYRKQGLGRATVFESIRRCAQEGATVVYVWSDLLFYSSLRFKKLHSYNCWIKKFSP